VRGCLQIEQESEKNNTKINKEKKSTEISKLFSRKKNLCEAKNILHKIKVTLESEHG
jgi:hypothetical protein